VLRDPWVLVAQAGSQQAALLAGRLSLRAIGRVPLVTFRAARAIEPVLSQFRAAGVELDVVLQSDYNDAVQELAAAGAGVALMPRLAVNPHDERTATIELGDLIAPREIAVAWNSDRTPSEAVTTFVTLATEVGAGLEGDLSIPDWQRTAAS
jgi:DNA-binding transcriptional LysR family regulator